jgi:hypothetical protein
MMIVKFPLDKVYMYDRQFSSQLPVGEPLRIVEDDTGRVAIAAHNGVEWQPIGQPPHNASEVNMGRSGNPFADFEALKVARNLFEAGVQPKAWVEKIHSEQKPEYAQPWVMIVAGMEIET